MNRHILSFRALRLTTCPPKASLSATRRQTKQRSPRSTIRLHQDTPATDWTFSIGGLQTGAYTVTAIGSPSDTSTDRAYLYDSSGGDTLKAAFFDGSKYQGGYLTDETDVEEGTYKNWGKYFDLIYARSSDSDTEDKIDVADEELLVYDLIRSGTW